MQQGGLGTEASKRGDFHQVEVKYVVKIQSVSVPRGGRLGQLSQMLVMLLHFYPQVPYRHVLTTAPSRHGQ